MSSAFPNFNNFASRTVFVTRGTSGKLFRTGLATILGHLGEPVSSVRTTQDIIACAQALVDGGVAVGVVILFDGQAILSAGDTSTIEPSEYN